MKKWECTVCGYNHEGDEPPEKCLECEADRGKFKDEQFLKLVRARIAAENHKKKSLARKCKVPRPQFSEILHGGRQMSLQVRERLIKELKLEPYVERLGL